MNCLWSHLATRCEFSGKKLLALNAPLNYRPTDPNGTSSPMTTLLASHWLTSARNSKWNIVSEGAKWERGRKNMQFSVAYLRNGARYDQGYRLWLGLLWRIDRKSHMRFRLAPRSMTWELGWPWTAISSNFLGILHYFAFLGGNNGYKRMKIEPHCQSATELLRTESIFQRCIQSCRLCIVWLWRMQVRGDLMSCVLYTKSVARLPLRQLGFLVNSAV